MSGKAARGKISKPIAIAIALIILSSTLLQTSCSLYTRSEDPDREQLSSISNASTFSNGIYLDYDMLGSFFDDPFRPDQWDFPRLFEEYLIPANVRLVILSVGWEQHANTTFSDIPYYPWVDVFLSTSDSYDIDVSFCFGSLKKSTGTPSWWDDLAKAQPELRSFFRNGTVINVGEPGSLAIDSPLIVQQLEEDLKQLYEYYGLHASWIGVAFGRPGDSTTYAPLSKTLANWGFSNFTFYDFSNSDFFLRDVDLAGHHSDGTQCKLWGAFKETKSLLVLSSAFPQGSAPTELHGGDQGYIASIQFSVIDTLNGCKVSWYGSRVGTPGNLILELYNQTDTSSYSHSKPLETLRISEERVTTQEGWQPFVEFVSTLIGGKSYSLIFKAEAANGSSKYLLYYRAYRTDSSAFFQTQTGISGKWEFQGGGILWIKDLDGSDKLIYPFQSGGISRNEGSNVEQRFKAPANVTFNTIFISVSDRPYDENAATIKVIRASDGKVVGEGILRPEYTKGTYWWIPIPLEVEATLKEGETYVIRLERMIKGIGWQWHYIMTDPPVAGFQGEARVQLFRLAYIDPVFINFMRLSPTPAGPETSTPGAEYTHWWAQRYRISDTALLLSIEVNIEKYGNPGDLVVVLRKDDGSGQAPADRDLEAITIKADSIPMGRTWFNVTGWNTVLQAGDMYWVILSTTEAPKGNGYWPWKTEQAYQFLIKRSADSGETWVTPGEPAELFVKVITTKETFAVEPQEVLTQSNINDEKLIAQSFSVKNDTTIYGLLVYFTRTLIDQDGILEAEIRTDSNFDTPSTMALSSGSLSLVEEGITSRGLNYLDFDYPYFLRGGVKYWIVLKANKEARIYPLVLAFHDPEYSYGGTEYKVKRSTNGGLSWDLPDEREADLLFGLVRSPFAPYGFTTEELAADVEMHHTHAMSEEPIRGWNVYLNVQTSEIQKELIQWFDSYTERKWSSIDPNPPRIIQQVQGEQQLSVILEMDDFLLEGNASSFGKSEFVNAMLGFPDVEFIPSVSLKSQALGPSETYYSRILPLAASPLTLLDIDSISELQYFSKSVISKSWNASVRMVYPGGYYGKEKPNLKVLFIGDEDSLMLAWYLASIIDLTLIRPSEDYNFTRTNDFGAFHVIVWASSRESMERVTSSAQRRIKEFIQKGGGFVVMGPWGSWADEIIGLSQIDQELLRGSMIYANYSHPILRPYYRIAAYIANAIENEVVPITTNVTYVIRDTNNQPWISVSSCGLGRSIYYNAPISIVEPAGDRCTTILINAIFYAARLEALLPVIWHESYDSEGTTENGLRYSLSGKPGGPLLLWLSNNGRTTRFEIHLNASFLQLNDKGWIALDVMSWLPVARGRGNDISIELQVTNMTWSSIYIMNDTEDLRTLYSNSIVEAETAYPNQGIYYFKSNHLSTVWLTVRCSRPVNSVMLGNSSLPRSPSLASFNSTMLPEAWFYDSGNGLVYLKITTLSNGYVRILLETPITLFSFLEEYRYTPSLALILLAVIVELFIIYRRRSSPLL